MARDIINRYVWIVDTLSRYGRLTRAQLDEMWQRSAYGDGRPIPERTFYYYRRAIEENFHIDIRCNSRGEYYIADGGTRRDRTFANWLLDSAAVSNALQESAETQGRIAVEEIPSAREFLPTALEAIRHNHPVTFTYAGFNRSRPERDIAYEPYFLKLYKQRWYMIGRKVSSGDIRTYALDRVRAMTLDHGTFEMPADLDVDDIFENIVGITSSKAPVRTVRLMAVPTQAKYFRALPLHQSQQEEVHDNYSIFTYRVKLNYELTHEILALGSAVKVIEPPELKAMVLTELRDTLRLYE